MPTTMACRAYSGWRAIKGTARTSAMSSLRMNPILSVLLDQHRDELRVRGFQNVLRDVAISFVAPVFPPGVLHDVEISRVADHQHGMSAMPAAGSLGGIHHAVAPDAREAGACVHRHL